MNAISVGRRWADVLVDRMHEAGLVDRVLWKISCRAEHVSYDLFAALRDAGLFLVYMGCSGVRSLDLQAAGASETHQSALERFSHLAGFATRRQRRQERFLT